MKATKTLKQGNKRNVSSNKSNHHYYRNSSVHTVVQFHDLGLYFRRHPVVFDAGTRSFPLSHTRYIFIYTIDGLGTTVHDRAVGANLCLAVGVSLSLSCLVVSLSLSCLTVGSCI